MLAADEDVGCRLDYVCSRMKMFATESRMKE
jgi:hypothetical protein